MWVGLRLLAAEQLSSMANVSGERFDTLMVKENKIKLPEAPQAKGEAVSADDAFAAYLAAQEGGDKKRLRPNPAEAEPEDEGEDSAKKGRKA